jgi:hypothetical protein
MEYWNNGQKRITSVFGFMRMPFQDGTKAMNNDQDAHALDVWRPLLYGLSGMFATGGAEAVLVECWVRKLD